MRKDSIFNDEKSYFNATYIIRKGFEKYLKEHGGDLNINRAETRFLAEIYYNEGISQREIAHNLYVSEANIAKTYKKLESKGLLYKTIDEKNNTRRQLYLTEKGETAFEDIICIYEGFYKLIVKDYPKEKLELTNQVLNDLVKETLKLLK